MVAVLKKQCLDHRLGHIRVSRPLVSYICRGVCHCGCFARYPNAYVVEGYKSKTRLVAETCRGGLSQSSCCCRKQNSFVTNPIS